MIVSLIMISLSIISINIGKLILIRIYLVLDRKRGICLTLLKKKEVIISMVVKGILEITRFLFLFI